MPRIARIVVAGLPYHITQRGNYQQNIFSDDNDRKQYLLWIQEYSAKYKLSILAYCLMNNHVHFVAIPEKEDSLGKTFNVAHMRYSQYYNKEMKTAGHLWQGRFYSCILDEPHLMVAVRYIERNPVRVKLVTKPWLWTWSSAAVHINKEDNPSFKLKKLFDRIDMTYDSWREYIETEEQKETLEKIRIHTHTGRPLGAIDFIQKLEKKVGKRLLALPRGRPRRIPN